MKHHLHYENNGSKTGRILSRCDGVHAFCIMIDEEARYYLPHMYADANNTVIDDVASLAVKVSDIYRRLTS
jgi:nitric oxide reductase NorD protein